MAKQDTSSPSPASKPSSASQAPAVKRAKAAGDSALIAPGVNLPPCQRDQMIDPDSCALMPGHQHPASGVAELAESITIVGQLHPGQVIELPDGRRWIAAGRRRWLACKARGFLYRADVWQCSNAQIARGEDLARVMRLVENEQRCDPSAYDLAVQLRRIRNEHAYQNAAEVARHVGMTSSRVKLYLSIFGGSDRLLDAIERHQLPISAAVELVRCEKHLGEAATRKYISRIVDGSLRATELARLREQKKHGVRRAKKRQVGREWRSLVTRARTLFAADPKAGAQGVAELLAALQQLTGAR